MDLKRAFFTWKWPACIAVVTLAFFWGVGGTNMGGVGMLELLGYAFTGGMVWLAFVPCTFVYGDCLCEDHERKFFRLAILQGGKRSYLFSKLLVCFFSALVTMCLGFLAFCLIASIGRPLYSSLLASPSSYEILCKHVFGEVLQAGYYPIYYMMVGLLYGMLAGILAVAAMCVSMWYPNRLLVFSMPVFLFYGMDKLTGYFSPPFCFTSIFVAISGNWWDNTLLSFGWTVLVTVIVVAGICFIMNRRIRMWLEHD